MAAPDIRQKGRIRKWVPRKWKAEYDRIVLMSVAGQSNSEIAEKIGITKEYVSVILNLPQGKEIYAKLQARLVSASEASIFEDLAASARLAAKRIKQVLEDEAKMEKSPFAVTGLAIDVLKGVGHLKGGGNGAINNGETNTNIGTVVINQAQKTELMEGFDKIAEVRKLHLMKEEKDA